MASGYITIDRKILHWGWYDDANTFRVFLHLLLTANYKKNTWKHYQIDRGQVVIGRKKLAETLQLTEMQVRTCLERLKLTNEITIKTTSKFSIVTVCKYDTYQYSEGPNNQQNNQQDNRQITNQQPTNNQQITTTNKDNKVIKKKELQIQYAFESDDFKNTFNDWIIARAESKKPLTQKSIEQQMKFLSQYPEQTALSIIGNSIMNGWQGLFPLNNAVELPVKKSTQPVLPNNEY